MSTKKDDYSAQADIINEAMADPVPEMVSPPDPHVQLIRGIYQKTDEVDKWHDVAEVRELTGEDEEYLDSVARKDKSISFNKYMSMLLQRGVLTIGDLDVQEAPQVIDKLIMPDREVLFLAMVKATYGDTRTIRAICRVCGADNTIVIELDKDFVIREPDYDIHQDLPVKTSKGEVRLRLPNGEDMDKLQGDDTLTDAQTNTLMLARCVQWPEGKAPADREEWARTLSIADRKLLINTMLEATAIGPDMRGVDTHCAECGEEMAVTLDWVSLLFG